MNRFCSVFSQLLQLFPRSEFQAAVKKVKAERHARGFSCWDQFVSMLFCQLGRAHSLREITQGLRTCEGKVIHPARFLYLWYLQPQPVFLCALCASAPKRPLFGLDPTPPSPGSRERGGVRVTV